MLDNELFVEWLDKKSKEIINKIGEEKPISSEEMIIMVLKAQANHFEHLDKDLRKDMQDVRKDLTKDMQYLREDLTKDIQDLREDMNKRFEQVDKRFEQVDKRFERVYSFIKWQIGIAVTTIFTIFGALCGIYYQIFQLTGK